MSQFDLRAWNILKYIYLRNYAKNKYYAKNNFGGHMKKFAVSVLGVLLVLGGILFSACEKKVVLSVSTTDVTIYTNAPNEENYKQANVSVTLSNSSAGVFVEVVDGQDCVHTSKASKRNDDTYVFNIFADKSGQAKVRVSAVDDIRQNQIITVQVNTVTEGLSSIEDNTPNSRSEKFVIKGSLEGKTLVAEKYFDFKPVTANIKDVGWAFENGQEVLMQSGLEVAKIEDGKLTVSEDFASNEITLMAFSKRDVSVFNTVTFKVLENSTINKLTVDGFTGESWGEVDLISGNEIVKPEINFTLKRNDALKSSVTGTIVVNTKYDVDLAGIFLNEKGETLSKAEASELFIFNVLNKRVDSLRNQTTYTFMVDVLDQDEFKKFGKFSFVLKVEYSDCNYDITTKSVKMNLDLSYAVDGVELFDENGDNLNNNIVDVFSSYSNNFGKLVRTILTPTDVAVDFNLFYISVNVENLTGWTDGSQVSDFFKIYDRGKEVKFSKDVPTATKSDFDVNGGQTYFSSLLTSGTDLHLCAVLNGTNIPAMLSGVQIKFVPISDPTKATSLSMNLYRVSTAEMLNVLDENGQEPTVEFMSSSVSENEITYKLKIEGITALPGQDSVAGLQLKTDENQRFKFSTLKNVTPIGATDFVQVEFSVSLVGANFESQTHFWFEHITGKVSEKFEIDAYVPLTNASIGVSSDVSANVYLNKKSSQDFVLENVGAEKRIVSNPNFSSASLSHLLVEAGSTVALASQFQSLAQKNMESFFLPYEDFSKVFADLFEDLNEQEIENQIAQMFKNDEWLEFLQGFDLARLLPVANYGISLTANNLTLRDESRKGLVFAVFNGFGENHEPISLVRVFALESFYAVHMLSSNVKETTLFTEETLSEQDMARSNVEITISLRADQKVPSYSNNLSAFNFISVTSPFQKTAEVWENEYYVLSNFSFLNGGRFLRFKVHAKSTNLQDSLDEILKVEFVDENGLSKQTEILLKIRNVDRVESVEWVNKTTDGEIYLNLSSSNINEKTATISTLISPVEANDKSLAYVYVPKIGGASFLTVNTSENGQFFNLGIGNNLQSGGMGNLYLLPKDMVKNKDGISQVLTYRKVENMLVAEYVPLSQIDEIYADLVGELEQNEDDGNYVNYFLNNNGQKILNKNVVLKIKVTIADGLSDETAIRIYTAQQLAEIDRAKHYCIMNNLTLSNWKSFENFSGAVFGYDEYITLTMTANSDVFVRNNRGTIRNLNFAGEVKSQQQNVGFVVSNNENNIENVNVDVNVAEGKSQSSILFADTESSDTNNLYVGAVAGVNSGSIKNCNVFGLGIQATKFLGSVYVGGVVGRNSGLVENCGVEFYSFKDSNNQPISNAFVVVSGGAIGGIVGYAEKTSRINKSYAYSYPLANETNNNFAVSTIFKNQGTGNLGLFMAVNEDGAKVSESFAYLGDLKTPTTAVSSADYAIFENSYLSYHHASGFASRIFENSRFRYSSATDSYIYTFNDNFEESTLLRTDDIATEGQNVDQLNEIWLSLNTDIWETGKVENGIWLKGDLQVDVNFGFMHLKNVSQNAELNVDSLFVHDVCVFEDQNKPQALKVNSTSGILMLYETTSNITDNAEKSALLQHNTISFADLFGLTARQAKTLVVTTSSSCVAVQPNAIKVLRTSFEDVVLTVASKMDFTKSKTFSFKIVNNLPVLKSTVKNSILSDGQTVLVQKGTSVDVVNELDFSIFLNGKEYQTVKGAYSVDFNFVDMEGNFLPSNSNLDVTKSGNSLVLQGKQSGSLSRINAFVTNKNLQVDFAKTLQAKQVRDFYVSIFDGATVLLLENTSNVTFKTSEYAVIDLLLNTDNENDNLVFVLQYKEKTFKAQIDEKATSTSIQVDEKLALDISWSKTQISQSQFRFRVVVKVDGQTRHLIDHDYDNLQLSINALSRQNSNDLTKTVVLNVKTQNIEDIAIQTYGISSRYIRNSVVYFRASNSILNTLAPSTDAIVAVNVNPAYALMTDFNITYEVVGETAGVGTVSISKLSFNENFGYYADSSSTTTLSNGLSVKLEEKDKKGNGVYYFRIYISSAFATNSQLKISVEFFNNKTSLRRNSSDLQVSHLQDATIKLGEGAGVSNYLLSKGDNVKVTVTIAKDQVLYNLYLQNHGTKIDLSAWTERKEGETKIYTATISAYVNATVKDSSGTFYVCADVERVINGMQEIKTSKASICLVDFSLDVETSNNKVTSGISIGSGATSTYNGQTYDVFNSYVGAEFDLNFNYTLMPEQYNYNKSDPNEVAAVKAMEEEKHKFLLQNNYANTKIGYYINHRHNPNNGSYEAISLKQQLSFATNENLSSPIYNENYDFITQSDLFSISEDQTGKLSITGKKSGRQLMKLTTTVIFQNIEFVYDYYFLIVVQLWSDEDTPTIISTAEEFVDFATNSETADDYILMNDIVLSNYQPLNTNLIKSLDGNGFTIHLNSFALQTGSRLNLALFNNVVETTTLKNLKVNVYGAGQIDVDVTQFKNINIAGFAISNQGVIYNCEVVSYKSEHQTVTNQTNGIVVNYTLGANTDYVRLSQDYVNEKGIESNVAGFVIENSASIVNSRVGGENFNHIVEVAGVNYIQTQNLEKFTIQGQQNVAGFVSTNSGNISASFAKCVEIFNQLDSTTSLTAGFVLRNSASVQNSYVEGLFENVQETELVATGSVISSIGCVAGFVHTNDGLVKNSYSNIAVDNKNNKPSYAAGFVYENREAGEITLCYTASQINPDDINQMRFSGVDDLNNSMNFGKISSSYFFSPEVFDNTRQSKITSGVTAVYNIKNNPEDSLYGFNFSSGEGVYNGIWEKTDHGISLVSANQIALSNRYAVTNSNGVINIFYNKSIVDIQTLRPVDLSYGSVKNPIIIRNAYDFAMATGKASTTEISSYKEFYDDATVFGNYRFVNNIDMSEIDQNSVGESSVKLTTTKKTLRNGLIDGNGFTISNINLGSSNASDWSYGLFSQLDGAVVMNANLIVNSVHNAQARVVGTLAGVAVDSRIIAVSLSPTQTNEERSTSLLGNNIVGGVVGMLFGDSVMYDIKVNNIEISSSYNGGDKQVGQNKVYVDEFRRIIARKADLSNATAKVSYVGALAGFVDVYNQNNIDYVKFSSSLQVSDYDIVNVHVEGTVKIYGEVAGGLFGYVGNDTYVYDANLKVAEPSYIIAKNLYSGGLIGENYGGLFAVSASFTDEIQQLIDNGDGNSNAQPQHQYYASSGTSTRGQMDIFSYKIHETDAPLYVGGLVGYMGGGYIYVGYGKLNVVSQANKTVAVGGIIGRADYTDTAYQLTFVHETPTVNILLNDVYASGALSTTNGWSGGIVGALGNNGRTSVIGMKNVLAVNYYSYQDQTLLGDAFASSVGEKVSLSDNHFALIGKIINTQGQVSQSALNNAIYIINNENDAFDLSSRQDLTGATTGTNTVGGYHEIKLKDFSIQLNSYGFELSWISKNSATYRQSIFERVLNVEHVGAEAYSTLASAYVRMNNYFLAKAWDEKYWVHTQDQLFPHIELIPKDNYIYWDATETSTRNVLNAMSNNSGITVIVRGKVHPEIENDSSYADVDLTGKSYDVDFKPIAGFRGTLISYQSFFDTTLGTVNTKLNGQNYGGKYDSAQPGIIISDSLFEKLGEGANIEGLNIYFTKSSSKDVIDYSLIKNEVNEGMFRNLNLVINHNVSLKTKQITLSDREEKIEVAGLITHLTYATSFMDIKISMRNIDNDLNNDLVEIEMNDEGKNDVYMGVLAGYIEQNSKNTEMTVQGIEFEKDSTSSQAMNVTFNSRNGEERNFFAGLYAGSIAKVEGSTMKVVVSLSKLNDVHLNIGKEQSNTTFSNMFVGGFVGKANGVSEVKLENKEEVDEESKGIVIIQNISATNFYAGLGFGQVTSDINISTVGKYVSTLTGAIYEGENATIHKAQVGGLAGNVGGRVSLQGFKVDFTVAKIKNSTIPNYVEIFGDQNINIFDENKYEYDLSPFQVSGGVGTAGDISLADVAFGGLFGYIQNADVNISGALTIAGSIDVAVNGRFDDNGRNNTPTVSVGGVVGKYLGNSFDVAVNCRNDLNIAVGEFGRTNREANVVSSAYVGGIVGWLAKHQNANVNIGGATYFVRFDGNVLSDVSKLIFGGGIGLVGLDESSETLSFARFDISDVSFGGSVKIYGQSTNGSSVTTGGVVGSANLTKISDSENRNAYKISNSLVFGDVFVAYMKDVDAHLKEYNFGGIVGKGTGFDISKSSSIMTSFNSRISTGDGNAIGELNVGAVVGANSEENTYFQNTYSSQVCLAYQTEEGNQDCAYGANVSFAGYNANINDEQKVLTSDDILKNFEQITSSDLNIGHKLVPYVVTSDKIYEESKISSFHNISWIALGEEKFSKTYKSQKDVMFEDFTNKFFVGNGQTFEVEDQRTVQNKTIGAFADVMGKHHNNMGGTLPVSANPTFNVVSGVVFDLDVVADVNQSNYYGGVAGATYGNSIVFGVAVKGDLSVGGDDTLRLGGLVGFMQGGMIAESYSDANITFRARTGSVAGIANVGSFNNNIKSTYSSGMIETYVNVPVYTFASFTADLTTEDSINFSRNLIDCYSISQTKHSIVDARVLTSEVCDSYFINTMSSEKGACSLPNSVKLYGQVLHGSDGIVEEKNKSKFKTTNELSLTYSDLATKSNSVGVSNKIEGETFSPWYFNPYCNYGFATHGFGFLKNVTTYTRKQTSKSEQDIIEGCSVVKEYSYMPVSYFELLKLDNINSQATINVDGTFEDSDKWFLGVKNAGKFQHMIKTVLATNSNYSKDYCFVITNDIDMSKYNQSELSFGQNIGVKGKNLVVDGQNHTLDFSFTEITYLKNEQVQNGETTYTYNLDNNYGVVNSSVFGTVVGDIENLRLLNINVNANTKRTVSGNLQITEKASSAGGTLANTLEGNIENITVVGSLHTDAHTVGGVVGKLSGNASAVESAVNVKAICGGVVGGVIGDANAGVRQFVLSHISNSGKVEVVGCEDEGQGANVSLPLYIVDAKGNKVSADYDPTAYKYVGSEAVVGGIVGRAIYGFVRDAYNANAVLANYTAENDLNNVAGGIIGYAYDVGIQNAYNTGIVGAGNYHVKNGKTASEGYSFAGGIFGYGTDMEEKVSNCINDAQVEAIGKVDGNDYDVKTKLKSGYENQSFTNNPNKIVYEVTMTYNPGKDRQVYAYGIGFMGYSRYNDGNTANVENCLSRTDTIKNDGCIGEISQTQTMEFDRKQILDNEGVEDSFYANFAMQEGMKANGFDSYGFPVRIYKTDKMTRAYMYKSTDSNEDYFLNVNGERFTNAIYKQYRVKANYWPVIGEFYYNFEGVYDQNLNMSKGMVYFDRENFNGRLSWTDFAMARETQYYSSVSFVNYDDLLKGDGVEGNYEFGLIGFKSDNKQTLGNQLSDEKIEDKIAEINSKIENGESLKQITIAGEKSAVVYSANNMKAVGSPFVYHGSAEFSIHPSAKDKISEKDFELTHPTDVVQIYDIEIDETKSSDTKIVVDFTAYMAKEIAQGSQFKVSFKQTYEGSVMLGNNNVFIEGGNTYILLENENGLILSKETIDSINKNEISVVGVGTGNVIETDSEIQFENKKFENVEFGWWDKNEVPFDVNLSGDGVGFAKIAGQIEFTDQEQFNVVLSEVSDQEVPCEVKVFVDDSTVSETVSEIENKLNLTYIGFEEFKVSEILGSTSFVDFEDENGLQAKKISLKNLETNANGKIGFGDDEYAFNFTSSNGWQIDSEKENDGVSLWFEEDSYGNTQLIVKQDGEDESAVENFANAFMQFEGLKNKKSISYEKGGENDSDLLAVGKEISANNRVENDLEIYTTYEIVNQGNFNVDGQYVGNDFDNEFQEGAVEVDEELSVSKFGLKFLAKTVKYSYVAKSFTFTSQKDLGFDLKYKPVARNGWFKQGHILAGEKQTIDAEIGDQIVLIALTTIFEEEIGNINGKFIVQNSNGKLVSFNYLTEDGKSLLQETSQNGEIIDVPSEDVFKNLFAGTENNKYWETSFSNSTDETYTYRIFENGTVSFSISIMDKMNKVPSIMYVTNRELMLEGKMYKVGTKDIVYYEPIDQDSVEDAKESGYTVIMDYSYVNDQGETVVGPAIEYETKTWDFIFKKNVTEEKKLDLKVFDKMPLIVSYFDDNTILFAKNDLTDLQIPAIKIADNETNNYSFNLVSDNTLKTEYNISEVSKDFVETEMFEANRFKSNGTSEWTEGDKIIDKRIGKFEYDWQSEVQTNLYVTAQIQGEQESFGARYVVFADDVHMDRNIGGSNTTSYYGNGFILKYLANENGSISFFKTQSGNVSKLNLIGLTSLISTNQTEYAMLSSANNSAIYRDIKLFGNIRNINPKANANVLPVVTKEAGNNLWNVKSFISMIGLDGQDAISYSGNGEDVNVVILDSVKDVSASAGQYQSQNIVVSGNGGHGKRGKDCVVNSDDKDYTYSAWNHLRNGNDGGNGGNGGKIQIQTNNFNGFVHLGVSGMAGFGGNGANGEYLVAPFNQSKVLSRGLQGRAGRSDLNINNGYLQRPINYKICDGNSGIDGFGRVNNRKSSAYAYGDYNDICYEYNIFGNLVQNQTVISVLNTKGDSGTVMGAWERNNWAGNRKETWSRNVQEVIKSDNKLSKYLKSLEQDKSPKLYISMRLLRWAMFSTTRECHITAWVDEGMNYGGEFKFDYNVQNL